MVRDVSASALSEPTAKGYGTWVRATRPSRGAAVSEQPENTEDLREEARKRMEEMPAETALGNRDPQTSGEGDPEDYQGNEGGTGS